MAQGKKSFIAYSDWKEVFDELPNEDAGILIKHIFAYVNDENPISDSVLIRAVFANIKATLKRDLSKWDSQLEQRKEAGKRSAEIRRQNSTSVNERSISSTDNVSVNVNVNNSVNDNLLLKKVTKDILLNDEQIILEVEKPKEKKSTKPLKEKKTHFVPLEPLFKNNELQASYLDYLEMRTLINKPMTKKAQELFKKRLEELSNKNVKLAVEIINQSISYTWVGIFEIKPDFKPKFEPKEDRRDPVLWLKKLTEKQENNILQIETPITPHQEI